MTWQESYGDKVALLSEGTEFEIRDAWLIVRVKNKLWGVVNLPVGGLHSAARIFSHARRGSAWERAGCPR